MASLAYNSKIMSKRGNINCAKIPQIRSLPQPKVVYSPLREGGYRESKVFDRKWRVRNKWCTLPELPYGRSQSHQRAPLVFKVSLIVETINRALCLRLPRDSMFSLFSSSKLTKLDFIVSAKAHFPVPFQHFRNAVCGSAPIRDEQKVLPAGQGGPSREQFKSKAETIALIRRKDHAYY